jgi:hypothetical protein
MSLAFVEAGTPVTASGGSAITVTFGQTTQAGNWLILWVVGRAGATAPTTPTGWSILGQVTSATGTGCSATIFSKIAAGGDASPVIAASGSITWEGMNVEFAGGGPTITVDQTGSATGTTSPLVATAAAVDTNSADAVFTCSVITHSAATAATVSDALNNGVLIDNTNTTVSAVLQYGFGYSLATTAQPAADANTWTFTTTPVAGATLIVSAVVPRPPFIPRRMPLGV